MFTRYLHLEYLIICCIAFLALFISFLPTIHHVLQTPQETVYTYGYNFYPDYFQFVSWMRDGGEGNLALTSRFTPEVFSRKFGHTFFAVLGSISSFFSVDYFFSFTFSRLLLGFLRLISIYFLICLICKQKILRVIAFLSVIFLPSFYQIAQEAGIYEVRYFLPGITNFDSLRRLTFLPHHMFATILMILGIILYGKALQRSDLRFSVGAAVFLFIACLVNPATILSMGSTLLFSFILMNILRFRSKRVLFFNFMIVFSGIFLAILYLKFYLFTVFPWDIFYTNDTAKIQWPFLHYIGALGWVFPLGILGIIFGKKYYHSSFYILLLGWAFAPIIGVFLSMYVPQISMFRLFQAQQGIPLGILSGIGLYGLFERFRSHVLMSVLFFIILVFSLPYYVTSFQEQIGDAHLNNYFLYLPTDSFEAFRFLDLNTKSESVVLAGYYSGQMLPAFSHNRVLVGHVDGTYEYTKKLDFMTKFYSGNYSFSEMDDLIKKNNISYFYFGSDTPAPEATSLKNYHNVKLVYKNKNNYIYQVIK